MTAPNEPTLHYGTRFVQMLALNSSGTPAANSTTPYEGIQIKGSVAFDLTIPEPRKITGNGEDGVTQVVFLPPLEGAAGVVRAEAGDPDVSALVDNTKVRTLGGATIVGMATNQQGYEPRLGLICRQAARGLISGANYWHTYILPSAQVVRQGTGMGAEKSTTNYSVAPNVCSAHLWGETMTVLADGYTSTQVVELWTYNPVVITSFVGNGTEDEFVFPAAAPSASTYATTTLVFVNGTQVTTNITITATKVTFGTGHEPALGARIDIVREIA